MVPRPEHTPTGDPCECGLAAARHRKRDRRGRVQAPRPNRLRKRVCHSTIVGVDGEGQTKDGKHLYTYLAAVDEHGEVLNASEAPEGLSTKQCLEFFVALANAGVRRVFGYSLGYDYTMMLRDLPDTKLWALLHEEARTKTVDGKKRIIPVIWAGYKLNYCNRRLTVCRAEWHPVLKRTVRTSPTIVIWDVFRFYAKAFTKSLTDWQIADEKHLEWMGGMKAQRASFDRLPWAEIKRYCQQECMYMAQLVRKLIDSHEDVGLKLRSFYGAGSSATAMLSNMGLRQYIREPPDEMRGPVAQAFFGGRFEVNHVGPVTDRIYNYDISSAYPYQCTGLPCLIHGQWDGQHRRGKGLQQRIENSVLALVRYNLPRYAGLGRLIDVGSKGSVAGLRRLSAKTPAYGPFPFRCSDGTIIYPLASKGGWVWKDEFLTAQRLYPNVEALEAWTYETDCDCRPFAAIPDYYRERLALGKEGAGLVLKLAINSIYGKAAQHRGTARFQSYVYAGNITSGTRAQLLDAMGRAANPWDVLMLATDGIFSRTRLDLPLPVDTGTADTGKPLGGWECKTAESGIFLVRPGIFFPLDEELDLDQVKARGVQRSVLADNRARVLAHWEAGKANEPLTVTRRLFIGAKSALTKSRTTGAITRSEDMCQWVERPMMLSMNPHPKRQRIEGQRLAPWPWVPAESRAYDPALISPEAAQLKAEEAVMGEQPMMQEWL